ncbi:MAG TPA: hypothetical protein VGR40_12255, partial [Candidatus Binatus sp.]|nr:hypothetical protein [Candidatus Binatus sp.]
IQIVHVPNATNSDSANFNLTFTSFGEGDCDGGEDDAIASGITVELSSLTCEEMICVAGAPCVLAGPIVEFPFDYDIDPFVAHTVGEAEYGNFFGLNPPDVGPGTVSARIVLLSRPVDGCGEWNLNVHATGLDLSSITSNPISLLLNDFDGSGPFCFDIDDAIIGNKISPAPVHRRGSRRTR